MSSKKSVRSSQAFAVIISPKTPSPIPPASTARTAGLATTTTLSRIRTLKQRTDTANDLVLFGKGRENGLRLIMYDFINAVTLFVAFCPGWRSVFIIHLSGHVAGPKEKQGFFVFHDL